VVDTLVVCAAIQEDLGLVEKWVNRNLMKFKQGNCQVLQLWRSSIIHQYRLWNDCLPSGFKEKSSTSR